MLQYQNYPLGNALHDRQVNQDSVPDTTLKTSSYLTDKEFSQFNLRPELLNGLRKAGFRYCTQIQAKTLPLVLAGIDVAGQAQTGTGKTAAFLLAIFEQLLRKPPEDPCHERKVRAVVLAPTRELAIQIHCDAEILGEFTGLQLGLVYGGTGYEQQRACLADGVDILIGTPGRFIDFFKQGLFDLKHTEVVILDEADRMFDLGFIKDIRYVLRRMPNPQKRLNMLFSATLSYRVKELAYEHMNDPRTVTVESETPVADRLLEEVYYPANNEKLPLLLGLMKRMSGDRVLIFSNTRVTCDQLGRQLAKHGYSVGVLSGDVPQKKREHLLEQFKRGQKQILVATDVAARGLHIPSVSHVFNYDLSQDPEDYVHRTGRTARAGSSGHAISFACEEHAFSLVDIETFIGHSMEKREITEDLLLSPVKHAPVSKQPKLSNRDTEQKQRGRQKRQSIIQKSEAEGKNPRSDNQNAKAKRQSHNKNNQRSDFKKTASISVDSTSKPRRSQDIPAIG